MSEEIQAIQNLDDEAGLSVTIPGLNPQPHPGKSSLSWGCGG